MNNILDVLGIVFLILKLCGVIDWKWIYVLIPFMIELLFLLFKIILFLYYSFIDRR